jgi:F0F1-type ATP synthase membrane subunit b/b'
MKQRSSDNVAAASTPKAQTMLLGIILFALTISITYYSQQTQVQSLNHQVKILHQARRHVEESHGKLTQELKTATHNLAQYKSTHEKMKKINHDMSQHMRRLKEEQSAEKAMEINARAEQAEGRLQSIVDSIRSASAQQVLQKYGPGPHQVELTVMLPGHHDFEIIKLELASIDTTDGMPHAVHTFLDQVDSGAWDGASFGFHAGHVLLAVPSATPSENKKPVPTILFPEYSNAYQHEEYTVAFPGRQGTGQDFYINVKSNVMNHAPRVQDGQFIEGEPCFAKITDRNSRKIIDAMNTIPVNENGSLKDRVIIQGARILSFAES